MPSPFPGVDPFIESSRKWKGFHSQFVPAIGQALIPRIRPRYVVDIEEYVWLFSDDDLKEIIGPDVAIADTQDAWPGPFDESGTATAVAVRPAIRTIVAPKHVRQKYLVIRNRDSLEVVTAIELLLPKNKRPGFDQRDYLAKRENVLETPASLVELDLLRGGTRLPPTEPLPAADFYAFVCRRYESPQVEFHSWTLREPLPPVPIPLAEGDPDVQLDLQSVFTTTYERAGYDYSLDYGRTISPGLSKADSRWARQLLKARVDPSQA